MEIMEEEIIKIIRSNNIIKLKKFLNENNINIKKLSNVNFDILIKAIENNNSDLLVKFIIINGHYSNLNYTIYEKLENIYKSPLSVAIANNYFKIAEILIEFGADINFINSDILESILNTKNINFLIDKGFNKAILLKILIKSYRNSLLNYTLENYLFNKNFILKLIHFYRNKISISNQELSNIINTEKYNIDFYDFLYLYAIEFNNFMVMDLLFYNDGREKNVIFNNFYNNLQDKNIEINFKDGKCLFINNFNKYIEKRNDIVQLVRNNNIMDIKYYLKENNIKLMYFNNIYNKYNDLLKIYLENNDSLELINFLIKECNYENLNYYVCIDGKIVSLLYYILSKNKFQISDLLIKNGANINNEDFLIKLYERKHLNKLNLKYIVNSTYNISLNFIQKLINDRQLKILNIILKTYIFNNYFILYLLSISKNKKPLSSEQLNDIVNNEKYKIIFDNSIYKLAIDEDDIEFLNSIIINDFRENDEILKVLFQIFSQEKENNIFYKERERYLNTLKNEKVLIKIDEQFINNLNNIDKYRQTIMNLVKSNNLTKLNNYIIKNKILFSNINNEVFDILIYAIKNLKEQLSSIEIIKYIISHYKSLNYCIYKKNKYILNYMSPLLCALSERKFIIANLLLKNGVNVNYKIHDTDITDILYHDDNLTGDILKYLIKNGYNVTSNLITTLAKERKYCYLNASFIKLLKTIVQYIFDDIFIIKMLSLYKNKTPLTEKQLTNIIDNEKNKIEIKNEWFDNIVVANNNEAVIMIFDNCGKEHGLTKAKAFKTLKKAVEMNNYVFIEKYLNYILLNYINFNIEDILSEDNVSDNLYIMKFITEKLLNSPYFDFKKIKFEKILFNLNNIKSINFIKLFIQKSLNHNTFNFKYNDFENIILVTSQFNNSDLMIFVIEQSLIHKTFDIKKINIERISLILKQISTDEKVFEMFDQKINAYNSSSSIKEILCL
ncbi:hypothetical protein H8356DRAFT_1390549 [Neocallimastix lanati (nom. inval.)]|uniref:Uncharacterized protein n=1 Tax=Neocallimastix californiae TaxID=1754190 RepID=A0A1Y2ADJ9_9FUNG|nr:hypothetical protein H8356DRAFT_1390549 [Neocallimastix sp. JGI-2020a]ORY20065.1 hypothetical protein LY90DRAFT_634539 [Neocallimastix californiae]|eukprot:ORY20065.1 hypothetical protein LY90DRAFT_634539 [Neocallimastix californiae]